MPTLIYTVGESADDAREASSTVTINGTSIVLTSALHYIGLSFATAASPIAEATPITLATLTYNHFGGGRPYLDWKGHKVTNSGVFTTAANNLSSRYTAGTTATFRDDATGLAVPASRSIVVTAIVQELVNQSGWTSTSRITLIGKGVDGNCDTSIRTWDYGSLLATLTVVTASGAAAKMMHYLDMMN